MILRPMILSRILPFVATILLVSVPPAFSQYIDNLGIHLNQQLWNRLQDHQSAERQRLPNRETGRDRPDRKSSSETRAPRGEGRDAAVIERLKKNIRALEAHIPQGRRITVATDGTVYIYVVGRVDEKAVIAFAKSVLKTKVILKRMP